VGNFGHLANKIKNIVLIQDYVQLLFGKQVNWKTSLVRVSEELIIHNIHRPSMASALSEEEWRRTILYVDLEHLN